jgi:hypothetical protein
VTVSSCLNFESSYARIFEMLQQSQPQISQRTARICRKQLECTLECNVGMFEMTQPGDHQRRGCQCGLSVEDEVLHAPGLFKGAIERNLLVTYKQRLILNGTCHWQL